MPYRASQGLAGINVSPGAVTPDWASLYSMQRGAKVGDTVVFLGEVRSGGAQGTPVLGALAKLKIDMGLLRGWIDLGQGAITDSSGKYSISWVVPWDLGPLDKLPCRDWAFKTQINSSTVWSNGYNVFVSYQTRISNLNCPTSAKAGEEFTVSGKLEYESSTGVWEGLGMKTVKVRYDGNAFGEELTSNLFPPGGFSITGKIPAAGSYDIIVEFMGSDFPAAARSIYIMPISTGARIVTYGLVAVPLAFLLYKRLR